MLSLVQLPDPINIMSSSTDWSNVFTTEFYPMMYPMLGATITVALILIIAGAIKNGLGSLHKKVNNIHYEDTSEGQYRKSHHMTEFD